MKRLTLLLLLVAPVFAYAQMEFAEKTQYSLDSVSNPQHKDSVFVFGDRINLFVTYEIDSTTATPHNYAGQAEDYLKNCYPVVNGIPYEKIKLGTITVVQRRFETILDSPGADKIKYTRTKYLMTYQYKLSEIHETSSDKNDFSELWKNTYQPLHSHRELTYTLVSSKISDQQFQEKGISLEFYKQRFITWFVFVFAVVLVLIFIVSYKDKFRIFRDEAGNCDSQFKNPFSLSKAQTFVWTFIIFGAIAYLWTVTEVFPILTGSHLILLGIAAGQRLIAKAIDQANKPTKNSKSLLNDTKNGCSAGFLTDILSDSNGASITRIQYLLMTGIFVIIFIHDTIYKLNMYDFSPMQLALMGVSAGIYLWNKQLDQQQYPFGLKVRIDPDPNMDATTLAAFKNQPPTNIDITVDSKIASSERVSDFLFNVRDVLAGNREVSVSYKIKKNNADFVLKGSVKQDVGSDDILVVTVNIKE